MQRRKFIAHGLSAAALACAAHPARAVEKKIRAALIGTSHSHAAGKLEAARKLSDWFDVIGACEPNESKRKAAAARKEYAGLQWFSEEDLLKQTGLEAVIIETDIADFVPFGLRCAEAGLHIHLEKPAGASLPAFKKLLDLCMEKKRVLQMGYMLRYNPAFEFCYKAVREGWLGQVHEIHAIMGNTIGAGARKEWALYPGGAMFELGCHLIDSAVVLLGKPEKVHAFMKKTRPESDSLADSTLAVLEYARATATIRSAAVDVERFTRRQFTVSGDKGSIAIAPLEPPQLKLVLAAPAGGYEKGTHQVKLPPPGGRYDAQILHFAQMIRGEKESGLPASHDLAVHETVLRACGMSLD